MSVRVYVCCVEAQPYYMLIQTIHLHLAYAMAYSFGGIVADINDDCTVRETTGYDWIIPQRYNLLFRG